ncbi:MAG TPA: DUF1015 family protein [Candidatus Polarisedimenticolaceae bacterium]|nr:DUF1015 family protein [Candidatus Polarisedimenticolaceae bacterium]
MIVQPFRGLRPRADLAASIPSLPYDVLDSAEARVLAEGDPYTFLHVVKAEIDLDPAIDVHDPRVYERARTNFRAMIASGWLVPDPEPAFYLYRQRMGGHVQTGIVGSAAVEDYRAGRIKRHEHTRPDKVEDRTRHAVAIGAHAGPVFLAYRDRADLRAFTGEATKRRADVDFVAKDGIGHALWKIDEPGDVRRIEEAFRDVPASYIADGHHRAAAYAEVALRRGDGPGERFLAVHFPASELRILDYNRTVADLHGLTPRTLFEKIAAAGFEITDPWPAKRPPEPGSIGIFVDGRWRLLVTKRRSDVRDPVAALDVSVLQDLILAPLLGIGNPRKDTRIAFVGGIRGVDDLERRVASGEAAVAFALYPTRLDDVMRVADAGAVMPPKSTWFEPKLRSGMVVRLL